MEIIIFVKNLFNRQNILADYQKRKKNFLLLKNAIVMYDVSRND